MYIDNGIDIVDGIKTKCHQCKTVLAVSNNGEYLLRKNVITYISLPDKICEIKCRDCGALNLINNFT